MLTKTTRSRRSWRGGPALRLLTIGFLFEVALAGAAVAWAQQAGGILSRQFSLVAGVDLRLLRRSGSWSVIAPRIRTIRSKKRYRAGVRACRCDPLRQVKTVGMAVMGPVLSHGPTGKTSVALCVRSACRSSDLLRCAPKSPYVFKGTPVSHTTIGGRPAIVTRKDPKALMAFDRHTVCFGEQDALAEVARRGGIGPGLARSVSRRFRPKGAAFWVVGTSFKVGKGSFSSLMPGVTRISYLAGDGTWTSGHWLLHFKLGLPNAKQAQAAQTGLETITKMVSAKLQSQGSAKLLSSKLLWGISKPKVKGTEVSMSASASADFVAKPFLELLGQF